MDILEKIRMRKEWVIKALQDDENQTMFQQIKLFAQLDTLNWVEKEVQ